MNGASAPGTCQKHHLFFLAQSGRDLVRQTGARSPQHFHLCQRSRLEAHALHCCLNTREASAPPATPRVPGVYFELAACLFFAASLACTALGIPCPNWLTVR